MWVTTVAWSGPLADVAAVGAGISVQRAAERAGNGYQGFQPGQPLAHAAGNHLRRAWRRRRR